MGLRDDLVYLDERIKTEDKAIEALAQHPPQRPTSAATARRRSAGGHGADRGAGDGRQFTHGRQASAWAGLVPGQHSSGGKQTLLGISKRGATPTCAPC